MLLWRWGTKCTPLEATALGRTTKHSVKLTCMSSTQVGDVLMHTYVKGFHRKPNFFHSNFKYKNSLNNFCCFQLFVFFSNEHNSVI